MKEAINYSEQALATFKKLSGKKPHEGVAGVLGFLGKILLKSGNEHKAIECLVQCLEMLKQIHQENPLHQVADTLQNLGESYKALGEMHKALDSFSKSYQIYCEISGPDGEDTQAVKKELDALATQL